MSDLGKDNDQRTETARWWTTIILGLGTLAAFVFSAGG